VVSELIGKATEVLINLMMLTYFAFIGGKFALRFGIMSIGAIIDAIPVLNVLPMTAITFVIAFLVGRIVQKVMTKVTQSTPLSKVVKFGKKVFLKT
jgi:hypothetical protein